MQELNGSLPTGTATNTQGINLFDFPGISIGWTNGAQTIGRITSQATISKPWTIYGWSIQGQGLLFARNLGVQCYGRLGKLLAALIVRGSIAPVWSKSPFVAPDGDALKNLIQIWDGSQDAPFPWGPEFPFDIGQPTPPTGGQFQITTQLPQPQRMNPGEQVGLGLWLTPSLVANTGITIVNASFTVLYDTQR